MKKKQENEMYICPKPFDSIEITKFGDSYNCCRLHLPVKLGNMYEVNSFDEVWNSEAAINIRKHVLQGDYSLCNTNMCAHLAAQNCGHDRAKELIESCEDGRLKKGPRYVTFCHDKECNIACVICRDEIRRNSDEELKKQNEKIETFFLPLLADAEYVTISAHGDPFGSRHGRLLIKRIRETYPNIKFEIFTNGILLNKANLENLDIINNLSCVKVSIHSACKETYAKIVRRGELYFDTLMKNLKYISELKKSLNFEFKLLFVVTSLNYQDLPDFIKIINELGADAIITEYNDNLLNSEIKHPEMSVANKEHPEFKNLVEVLNHPIFYSVEGIGLSPLLRKIQAEGKINS